MSSLKQKFQKSFNVSIVILAFFLPISVFLTDLMVFLSIIFWFASGDLKEKFKEIGRNRILLSILLFELLYIAGLLWTNDLDLGLKNLKKEIIFLIAPILGSIVISERIRVLTIGSFVISMLISVVLSLLLNFNIIPVINPKIDPNLPFMGHIDYTTFLSIAIMLIFVYFDKLKSQLSKKFLFIVLGLMILDLLITKGRAGQVAFIGTFVLFLLFRFKNSFKKFILGFIALIVFTISSYFVLKPFKDRVDEAINQVVIFKKNPNTSVGKRIAFFINSLEVIQKSPVYGHGTGGFDKEYAIVNQKNSPSLPNTINPHNNYIYVLCEFGILGLIIMFNLFYQQGKNAFQELTIRPELSQIKLIIILTYLMVMFSGCFIFYHNSTVLYGFFAGLLFSNRILPEEVSIKTYNLVLS